MPNKEITRIFLCLTLCQQNTKIPHFFENLKKYPTFSSVFGTTPLGVAGYPKG